MGRSSLFWRARAPAPHRFGREVGDDGGTEDSTVGGDAAYEWRRKSCWMMAEAAGEARREWAIADGGVYVEWTGV